MLPASSKKGCDTDDGVSRMDVSYSMFCAHREDFSRDRGSQEGQ
ncbi:MAG: hypothetical protein A4E42_00408 [Methanoregulaceae archaeon PtaU1.Bin222]|nr:MAG: hypothetical protein A4E42_00408 [Methanoregulaceae archaeon PtaU1.Bin222]